MKENPEKNLEDKNSIKSEVREWTESIIIALILAIFIRAFFIQAFKIPSGSMRPTLIERDRLMVSKLCYGPLIPFTKTRIPGFSKIKRGDVIVFVYPEDKKRDFIKRVIGLPGEMLEIRDGDIYINGDLIEDPLIKNIFYYNRKNSQYGKPDQIVEIPREHVFVLGDNSQSSHDSRYWGFVPLENIIGKAEFIYWPFDRMRMIK